MSVLKVLIAEDEELLRDLYEIILASEFECEFIKVPSGEEAVEVLKQHQDINLIISDYGMAHGCGGIVYDYNKSHKNIPFFLISAGDLRDYSEFVNFTKDNSLNAFLNKPFSEVILIAEVRKVFKSLNVSPSVDHIGESYSTDGDFIKILLSHYAKYTTSSCEVYLKLADNKYTKIVNSNDVDVPDAHQIAHYLKKGIDYVYIKRPYFNKLLKEVFDSVQNQILLEKKAVKLFEIHGVSFQVSFAGLNAIGINEADISTTNKVIDQTISGFLQNKESQKNFLKYCEGDGFLVGHSLLIIYIAGKICSCPESPFNFHTAMKKITAASFFHDFSLLEIPDVFQEMNLSDITDKLVLNKMLNHPLESAKYLPHHEELFEETKKIILEHHEMPDGSGYPKNLKANQISPYACLFIISEQMAFCLIRNNFSRERLRDFLQNSQEMYSQGNFSKIYKAAISCVLEKISKAA